MEHVHLNGTSYEVGLQHGRALAHLIPRVIATSERNQTKRKDAL